jgi:capsular polysaccharide biosynthesis protein
MPYPPLHLRHYSGRIAFYGGTLFCTNRSILPDSFRWHLEPIPRNPKIRSMSDTFAKLKPRSRPTETLTGDFYQLDPQFSGHFGHIMTEVVGRLWGWDEAKSRFPDLKAIFRVDNPDRHGEQVQRRLLRAYGIADEDIVVVDHPVNLESLVSATVMWHNAEPHYTHPALREVWDRLRTGLADPDAPTYEKIFISRTEQFWRRSCRNIGDVERFFASQGFTVVHPEKLDLSAQVSMFAAAKVVAGFGGSALFNVMYAQHLECLIILNHEAYIARNEHLYTALTGGAVHYFWSKPDVPQPESFISGADRRWSGEAFVSGWEFDFHRNRAPLEHLLATL